MNRNDLDKKRLGPCVAEIYTMAKGPTTECYPQSFETWRDRGVFAFYNGEGNPPLTVIPMDCYYISETDLKRIVEKWSKGLHGCWYYIPKLTYGEPGYEEHVKELEDFRKFESEVSRDKTLTYAQRAAKIKKEALAHNFRWRSYDKEYINFNVYLCVSPSSNKEVVERNHIIFAAIEEAAATGRIDNLYIDYVHMNTFTYTKDGQSLCARVEEKQYYFDEDKNKLYCIDTPGRKYCNLYDKDGNYVDNLWNYVEIRKAMSAQTMDLMIERYTPVVIETLKSQGHGDIAEKLTNAGHVGDNLKQCFAVWIMKQWYLAEQTGR